MPGVIKIGATRREPDERLDEANASDPWRPPHPYAVTCAAQVDDPFACERAIHTLLAARRVSHEFFELTALEARALFSLLAPQAEQGEQSEENEQPEQAEQTEQAEQPRPRAWSAESRLRAWVEARYTHVPLREKDSGTRLEALYTAYASAVPPVHTRPLGKILFAKMLASVYPNIGPHRGCDASKGLFLLR
jgi:hypothetical protein